MNQSDKGYRIRLTQFVLIFLLGFHGVSNAFFHKDKACDQRGPGKVVDEAKCVGRTADSFPAADEDYFRDMDYGFTKNPAAVAKALAPYVPGITPEDAVKYAVIVGYESRGNLDFLKTLSSHPSLKFSRNYSAYFTKSIRSLSKFLKYQYQRFRGTDMMFTTSG